MHISKAKKFSRVKKLSKASSKKQLVDIGVETQLDIEINLNEKN